ncbi:Fis family transcriptional regulator [Kitasatospora indigofera]|uniref:Fis family transcriptional regulator n=1 Tax=Kitasatospora indigofera TaxID=67307 RepID=A0A919FB05_9ACTN|nr:PucR family transcriptional regulator [Kitasatospora indigofera]GHH59338.1 Fis family transcriptional regulator [Kitasatospora indigofera]
MTAPWTALPRSFSTEMRKDLGPAAAEIIREIRLNVPEFGGPLAGPFGVGIQQGVEKALGDFVDLVEGVEPPTVERLRAYRALGRGELAEGRTPDALQAAYRLGAQVAWRRIALTARRTGVGPGLMASLAEALFAHINEIAAASLQGYADARSDSGGPLGRRRQHLLGLLAAGAPAAVVEAAAADARWPIPRSVAFVVLSPAEGRPDARRGLPDLALVDLDPADPHLLLPEPALYRQDPQVRRLLHRRGAVIGPSVPPAMAADSLRWARQLRERLPDPYAAEPVDCDAALPRLLLNADEPLVRLIARRRLAPLDGLTPKQTGRLSSTLLALLQSGSGSAPEVAARLGIHPQTARQRIHRLQDLFGSALSDPDARFELEVALRSRLVP